MANKLELLDVIPPNALTLEEKIRAEQLELGYDDNQREIDSGSPFKGDADKLKKAERLINAGVCFLPNRVTGTYYGNPVPSRNQLAAGSIGTLAYTARILGVNMNN